MRLHRRDPYPDEERILAGQPPIDVAMRMCVRAWRDLGTCRQVGMAVGAIPFTAILTWAEFHRLDRDATTVLIDVVQKLDRDFAEREASKHALRGA